jgi:hypothetical protein
MSNVLALVRDRSQGRGLERMARAFRREKARSKLVQFPVNLLDQQLLGVAVAVRGGAEQLGDFRHGCYLIMRHLGAEGVIDVESNHAERVKKEMTPNFYGSRM